MRFITTLILLCTLLFASNLVYGSDSVNSLTKKEAISKVLEQYKGKVLKVTSEGNHFIVRILKTDGRVVDLKVDKNSGTVEKD